MDSFVEVSFGHEFVGVKATFGYEFCEFYYRPQYGVEQCRFFATDAVSRVSYREGMNVRYGEHKILITGTSPHAVVADLVWSLSEKILNEKEVEI